MYVESKKGKLQTLSLSELNMIPTLSRRRSKIIKIVTSQYMDSPKDTAYSSVPVCCTVKHPVEILTKHLKRPTYRARLTRLLMLIEDEKYLLP